ncbi:MAG: murein biosynthesis integral membrane protein MurJ [Gammaproteobacteria bacterium]
MNKNNRTFLNTIKVSFWTFLSRIAGLLRDIATTSLLGASFMHDVFVIALKIPNVFRRLFAEGAFSQAFIPIYSQITNNEDKGEAKRFVNNIFALMLLVLFVVVVVGLFFSPVIAYVFAPGFYLDPEKKDLTIKLIQIMLPYLGLISLVAFAAGIQNTHQKFSLPAATPLIFNTCLIIAALLIAPKYDMEVFALAWGVLIAGIVQLIIQIAPLRAIDRLPVPVLNFSNPRIKEFFVLIGPAILAGGIAQINLLIDTIFASLLITGSPTWLYVSDRLLQFPLGVFAIALGTVLLPTLSKQFSSDSYEEFKAEIDRAITLMSLIAFPSLCGLVFFGEPIIQALFLRGEFTLHDMQMSYLSLVAFMCGLPFFMGLKVLIPAFFSRKDTKTPMKVACLGLILNIFLNYFLAFYLGMGHTGLALASSISAFIIFGVLFLKLCKLKFMTLSSLFNFQLLKILSCSILLSIFLYLCNKYVLFHLQSWPLLGVVLIVLGCSIALYFYATRLLGLDIRTLR